MSRLDSVKNFFGVGKKDPAVSATSLAQNAATNIAIDNAVQSAVDTATNISQDLSQSGFSGGVDLAVNLAQDTATNIPQDGFQLQNNVSYPSVDLAQNTAQNVVADNQIQLDQSILPSITPIEGLVTDAVNLAINTVDNTQEEIQPILPVEIPETGAAPIDEIDQAQVLVDITNAGTELADKTTYRINNDNFITNSFFDTVAKNIPILGGFINAGETTGLLDKDTITDAGYDFLRGTIDVSRNIIAAGTQGELESEYVSSNQGFFSSLKSDLGIIPRSLGYGREKDNAVAQDMVQNIMKAEQIYNSFNDLQLQAYNQSVLTGDYSSFLQITKIDIYGDIGKELGIENYTQEKYNEDLKKFGEYKQNSAIVGAIAAPERIKKATLADFIQEKAPGADIDFVGKYSKINSVPLLDIDGTDSRALYLDNLVKSNAYIARTISDVDTKMLENIQFSPDDGLKSQNVELRTKVLEYMQKAYAQKYEAEAFGISSGLKGKELQKYIDDNTSDLNVESKSIQMDYINKLPENTVVERLFKNSITFDVENSNLSMQDFLGTIGDAQQIRSNKGFQNSNPLTQAGGYIFGKSSAILSYVLERPFGNATEQLAVDTLGTNDSVRQELRQLAGDDFGDKVIRNADWIGAVGGTILLNSFVKAPSVLRGANQLLNETKAFVGIRNAAPSLAGDITKNIFYNNFLKETVANNTMMNGLIQYATNNIYTPTDVLYDVFLGGTFETYQAVAKARFTQGFYAKLGPLENLGQEVVKNISEKLYNKGIPVTAENIMNFKTVHTAAGQAIDNLRSTLTEPEIIDGIKKSLLRSELNNIINGVPGDSLRPEFWNNLFSGSPQKALNSGGTTGARQLTGITKIDELTRLYTEGTLEDAVKVIFPHNQGESLLDGFSLDKLLKGENILPTNLHLSTQLDELSYAGVRNESGSVEFKRQNTDLGSKANNLLLDIDGFIPVSDWNSTNIFLKNNEGEKGTKLTRLQRDDMLKNGILVPQKRVDGTIEGYIVNTDNELVIAGRISKSDEPLAKIIQNETGASEEVANSLGSVFSNLQSIICRV